ncbi:MAG: proton-conducting transporter membrane subunit [Phycisphaeraceae bacterium]
MTNHWIILFCLIPLLTGLLSVSLINQRWASRTLGAVSLAATFGIAVALLWTIRDGEVMTSQMGGWAAPFGITMVFDSLSGLLLAAASLVALGSYIHSFCSLDPQTERRYFHPLIHLLMFGVNLSFLTGDLFNLFVAFEIMLMASYALLVIGTSKPQLSQAYKYVLLNLLASTIFVMAAGMVYGMMGTLNIADLARIVSERQMAGEPLPAGFTALGVLLLLVFGLKGAFFPLWFWLPDTYWTPPIAVAGLFGGMLTKVGVYAVARTFPLVFAQAPPEGMDPTTSRSLLLVIFAIAAPFTMFLAVLGAVSHHNIRRILAVHVISQVGYMVFAFALMSAAAIAGCVLFIIHNMVVKCSLFLCCGVMEKHAGTDDLDKLGGLLKRDAVLATLFFIAAMSLVGLPPLSGFFGKLVIIQEGFVVEGAWWLSIVGLVTGALTLLSMLKIWSYGFWSPGPAPVAQEAKEVKRTMRPAYAGIALLVAAALFLGFGAQPVYTIAKNAGTQAVEPDAYIRAVLPAERLARYDSLGIEHEIRIAEREAKGIASRAPDDARRAAAATLRADAAAASVTHSREVTP